MREPPRPIERFVRLWLPRGARGESMLGDLREEHARRSGERSVASADAWYALAGLGLAFRYAVERVSSSRWRRRFGEPTRRPGLRVRLGAMPGDLIRDVRHGLRRMRRNPAFTIVAIITLGLGIGANAATFAFIDAMAYRPLPVEDASRLVALFGARRDARLLGFSYPDLADYRSGSTGVFEGLAGFADSPASLSDGGSPVMVWTHLVTPGFFDVVRPRLRYGRGLGEADEGSVVLSHGLWVRRFGADPDVVGRTITLNGQPFTVVGVTARRFTGTRLFSYAPELWLPLAALARIEAGGAARLERRDGGLLQLVGRLERGVTIAQADAAAERVARSLGDAFPESHGGRTITIYSNARPLNPWAFEPSQLRTAGAVALAGVSLVLLIACANVANLQLARATTRSREASIRLSLGASRGRLVRSWMVESLILSLAGGAAGVLLAVWLTGLSASFQPDLDFGAAFEPAVEWRVAVFTLLAATAAGLLAGALPAVRQAGTQPAMTLRAESGGARRTPRLLDVLVVVQIAFSFVVLVSAGLFARSLGRAREIDPGFPLRNGLVMTLDPAVQGYSPERAAEFWDDLLAELRALPGVRSATRARSLPLDGNSSLSPIHEEGRESDDARMTALEYTVEAGFFETLGVPVLEGREFREADDANAPAVAIVNQTLARRLRPSGSPVGLRLQIGDDVAEVVGVVRDTRLMMLSESPQPMFALSVRQYPSALSSVLVRTIAAPESLAPAVRSTVAALDPTLALIGLKTLEENASYTLAAAESGAAGAGIFGTLALLLTVAGVYGVVSYGVAARTREIGIRMALGAGRTTVVNAVVGRGLRLAAVGIGIGLLAALATGRLLAGLLYGVSPTDAPTLSAVTLLLTTLTTAAAWVPARRAAGIDPSRTLRAD